MLRGDLTAAESRLQQAAALVAGYPWLNWRLQLLLGLAQGRLALAEGALCRARRGKRERGRASATLMHGWERTRVASLEGEASAAAGRADAEEKLLAALTMARDLDNAALLVDAALAVAQRSPSAAPDARPLAESAIRSHRRGRASRVEGRVRGDPARCRARRAP